MDKNNDRNRLVLLDVHAILHRAYHALPDFMTAKGEPTGALYGLSSMLIKIIDDLKPDYLIACYDVKGPTHRHELYKAYKADRKKAEDDLIKQIIKSREVFISLNIPIYDKQGFEADDILGTIVEKIKNQKSKIKDKGQNAGLEIIIASGDMDTMQLVKGDDVKVYTLKKGINDTIIYNENAVNKRFGFGPELIPDYKGLRGDPSDNIPGIKGIGEKTATILIQRFGKIENIFHELELGHKEEFEKIGITPRMIKIIEENKEEAEFSKMLATINKDVPIDFELPTKTFKENIDSKKIGDLWRELEFRTLPQRFEKVIGGLFTGRNLEDMVPSPTSPRDSANMASSPTIGLADTDKTLGEAVFSRRGLSGDRTIGLHPASEEGSEAIFAESRGENDKSFKQTAIALWLLNSNTTNPKMEDVLNFAGTNDFDQASKIIFKEIDQKGLRKVYDDIELPLIDTIDKMEKRGIKINKSIFGELSKKYHIELEILEKKIWDIAGCEFNINSPKQLGELLFDKLGLKIKNAKKTGGGARSTRESELEKMVDMHPIINFIFQYRELAKLLSTYIDAIPPLLDANNRLHTHFLQTGTTTGRMASQDPNMQNIPIRSDYGKAIRKGFVAEEGFKLVAFDYSQMELRISAFLSLDEKLIEIFRNGEDVHTSVASFVFGVDHSSVTKEMRRKAKVINFGILYGMGVNALKQNLKTSKEEAQKFMDDYFRTFSGLASYIDKVKSETANRGYTETFFGRRRYFEGIKSRIPYIKAQAERMAINAPIQGTEADVIKLAMVKIEEYFRREDIENDAFLLLQVHDELICEVKEDIREKVSRDIKNIMESIIDPKDISGIVLSVEVAIGNDWGELK
ncbi:MAG: DNA polymerase [Candidatus Paceibacterota bacterium]|jgi:DNA polymerase-1